MLISTRGIVLYQADYSETSLIVKIYTEQLGLQSYIVKGVRKKGSRIRRNLFSPLSMLEMVVYYKESSALHLLKDVSCHRQFNAIATDITRSSVLLFMNELLYRSIPGEMTDKKLFSFIYNSIVQLDQSTENIASYPLHFAIQLASYLGFEPHNNYSSANSIFDMQGGNFCAGFPDHSYYLIPPLSQALAGILAAEEEEKPILFDHASRTILLEKILEYYRLHLPSFGEMKSHRILNTVLRD